MARRLSYMSCLAFLAAVILLLAGERSAAQSPGQPPPPTVADKPKPAEPATTAKKLSTLQVDGLIEKAFGAGCKELQRPLRLWIPARRLLLAAGEFNITKEGQIRLAPFSAMLFDDNIAIETIRGESAVITCDARITELSALANASITAIDVDVGAGVTLAFPIKAPLVRSVGIPELPSVASAEVIRFKFKIDLTAPLCELLPAPPKTSVKLPPWTNEDLTMVPELTFGEPISKELPKQKAMETTAHVMAKINHLNWTKTDGFMRAMLEQRPDLRGLPFLMGEQCRTREEQATIFAILADLFRKAVDSTKKELIDVADLSLEQGTIFAVKGLRAQVPRASRESVDRAAVAAATQILMPESATQRAGLARYLAAISHVDATKALARLAIFSTEESVRAAAIEGLKTRREKDYTDILMQGFRYPLPAVSKRSAEALVKLERKDLLANLIEVLEQPDPRLPMTHKQDGKEVTFVRELVRVNHHRNCLLCHAPGNTDNTPDGVLKVAVPLPSEPLPKPSDGGGYQSTPPPSPDIVVRLDMTYLRQDFSLMMPVSDAHPWPEMQRFDFLVRTRTLTPAEAQAYEPCCEDEEPGRLSPYHRSALYALRELTGRDTEPTAAAWRKLLKLPR
jgi:hypothetical protein